ncbi:MAG: TolC family protein [Hellea sp.]
MSKSFFISVAFAVLLSGCATTQMGLASSNALPNLSVSMPAAWEGSSESAAKGAGDRITLKADQIGWLNKFDDTVLTDLVAQAYTHNPNLKRLQARLDRAEGLSSKAKSGLLPAIDAALGASRIDGFEGENKSSASLNAGLDITWDADLWGRIAASSRASNLRSAAAQADYEAGQQLLAASIVENYFLAIEARRLARVSQNNLEALNKTLGFVTVQYQRGLRSGQDISLIRADVASAKVAYNRAEGAARDALRALEILIGTYPETSRAMTGVLPGVPKLVAIGQPANVLSQRPDIQAAQYRVEAAYAAHKSTKAAQRPNLSLGGVIGSSSSSLGQLFDPSAMASTLFANLTAPIFDGGSRKADVAIAQADINEALANYQDVVLTGLRDVERQIDDGQILLLQETELMQALSDARDALRFTQFRYESAESDLLNVLQVQQRVSFIEAQLVSTRRARLVQYINLALALGVEPSSAL